MMSEDRLGGFHGGQPLSSAAAATGVVVYILFSSRAAPSHALFFRAWRAGWRPVLGVLLRANDATSPSLHSVKKLPFTIFTTYNAKRPFIMIRYSYYSTFRHLLGKKVKVNKKIIQIKKSCVHIHHSDAENCPARFHFCLGLKMQNLFKKCLPLAIRRPKQFRRCTHHSKLISFFITFLVFIVTWITNEQRTNYIVHKSYAHRKINTDTYFSFVSLSRLNPAVKKSVLKQLGSGMCGKNVKLSFLMHWVVMLWWWCWLMMESRPGSSVRI